MVGILGGHNTESRVSIAKAEGVMEDELVIKIILGHELTQLG